MIIYWLIILGFVTLLLLNFLQFVGFTIGRFKFQVYFYVFPRIPTEKSYCRYQARRLVGYKISNHVIFVQNIWVKNDI